MIQLFRRAPEGSCSSVCVLVCDEDLPSTDDLRQWNALVLLPILNSLRRVNEDDEVVTLALVVDLGLGIVSTHVGLVVWNWDWGLVWSFRRLVVGGDCWYWKDVLSCRSECRSTFQAKLHVRGRVQVQGTELGKRHKHGMRTDGSRHCAAVSRSRLEKARIQVHYYDMACL